MSLKFTHAWSVFFSWNDSNNFPLFELLEKISERRTNALSGNVIFADQILLKPMHNIQIRLQQAYFIVLSKQERLDTSNNNIIHII